MNSLLALPERIAPSHRDLLILIGRLCIGALFIPDTCSRIMNFSGFAASLALKSLPLPMSGRSGRRSTISRRDQAG